MLSTSTSSNIYQTSSTLTFIAGTIKNLPLDERQIIIPGITQSLFQVTHRKSTVNFLGNFQSINMFREFSLDSPPTESNASDVAGSSAEQKGPKFITGPK